MASITIRNLDEDIKQRLRNHLPPPKADSGVPFLVIGDVRTQRINFLRIEICTS